MDAQAYPHSGRIGTAALMRAAVVDYWSDLGNKILLPFPMWYAEVKGMPYQSDDEIFGVIPVREIVARPKYLLDRRVFPKIDCKKKAILIAAWAEGNRIPWQFVGVRESEEYDGIHHVFPILYMGSRWVTADATFPEFYIGQEKPALEAEIL